MSNNASHIPEDGFTPEGTAISMPAPKPEGQGTLQKILGGSRRGMRKVGDELVNGARGVAVGSLSGINSVLGDEHAHAPGLVQEADKRLAEYWDVFTHKLHELKESHEQAKLEKAENDFAYFQELVRERYKMVTELGMITVDPDKTRGDKLHAKDLEKTIRLYENRMRKIFRAHGIKLKKNFASEQQESGFLGR